MAMGSQPDSVFYGLYDAYVGEARTKPEVYGYWVLVCGLLAVLAGVGIFLVDLGVATVSLDNWAIGVGASGGVGLLLGSVLQLPLRRRAVSVAVAGGVCSLLAVLVFVQVYPEGWDLGRTVESLAVVVGYVGGLSLVAAVAALVPVLTGRRSLLLPEESVEKLAWTAGDDEAENVSAVLHGEAVRDGVFAVFPDDSGWRWWFVEQTAVADSRRTFETQADAESALDAVTETVVAAGLMEVTHPAIRLYRSDDEAHWTLVDGDGVVLADSDETYPDRDRAETAANLLKEHGPGAPLLDVDDGAFEVYGDGSAWRWRLVDEDRGVLGDGTDAYDDRGAAEAAVVSVREAIQSAPVMGVEHVGFELRERDDDWDWRLVDAADTTVARAATTYPSRAAATDAVARVAEGAIDVPFITATAPGYEVFEAERGGWRWRLVDDSDEVVARGERAVPSEESGRSVVGRVKDIAADATVRVLDDAEFELFSEGDAWAWRLVTEDRRTIARSPPSATYESEAAAEAAVDRVSDEIERVDRTTFERAAFHLFEAEDGGWNWRLVDADGRVVSDSGQEHASREDAASAMSTMKEHAPEADLVEIDSTTLECYEADGEWHWRLVDAAGETLATSPGRYDSHERANEAMDALELLARDADARTMDAGLFQVYVSDAEPRQWHWRLVHPDGAVVATSVAGYPTREDASEAAESVAEFAADATVHTISDLAVRFVAEAVDADDAEPAKRWHWELVDRDREPLAVGTERFPSRDAVAATARLFRDHAGAASVFEVDPAAFRIESVEDGDGSAWRWRLVDSDRTTLAVGSATHESRERADTELDRVRELAGGAGLLDFDRAAFEVVMRDRGWVWQFVDTDDTVLGVSARQFDSRPAAERALSAVRDQLTSASLIEVESPAFELHSEGGDWRWRLVDADGSTIAESMRQYPTRREAREALDSLRSFGADAPTELPA
jgi:uncharacterized protein YegP (UPF0339 family)